MKKFGILVVLAAALAAVVVLAQQQQKPSGPKPGDDVAQRQEKMYGYKGVVKGRLTHPDGSPAGGFLVRARFEMHQSGAPGEGYTISDDDGRYEIHGLTNQRFYIEVENGGKPYVPSARVLADLSTTPTVTGVDFTMTLGPKITVRVKDAETGKPVPGLTVNTIPGMYGGTGQPVGKTDAKGEFEFRVGYLDIVASIEDPNKRSGFTAAPGSNFYQNWKLTSSKDITWDVLAYSDGDQPHPTKFRGTVVDAAGAPVVGAAVTLNRYGDMKRATSDAKGNFEFDSYRINSYEEQRGGGAVIMATKDGIVATKIPTAQETWGTIRVVMDPASKATISGLVVDEKGKPIPDCDVTYWLSFRADIGSVQPSAADKTGPDGRFTVPASSQGSYHFTFGGSWYESTYGSRSLGTTTYPPNKKYGFVEPKAGQNLDLGKIVVPMANEKIGGQIVDANGKPVAKDVQIQVKGEHVMTYPEIDKDGRFLLKHLVKEPMLLRVFVTSNGGANVSDDSPDLLLKRDVKPGDLKLKLVVKMRPPAKP